MIHHPFAVGFILGILFTVFIVWVGYLFAIWGEEELRELNDHDSYQHYKN